MEGVLAGSDGWGRVVNTRCRKTCIAPNRSAAGSLRWDLTTKPTALCGLRLRYPCARWLTRQFIFLNLVGLSTGLACSLLIYLWVIDELSVARVRGFQAWAEGRLADGDHVKRLTYFAYESGKFKDRVMPPEPVG